MSLTTTILKDVDLWRTYSVNNISEEVIEDGHDWKMATNNFHRDYSIDRIEKVTLPFLHAAFLIRQHEYKIRGWGSSVTSLMHSTGTDNVESILRVNLDYRRANRQRHGVGFTNDAGYGHRQSSANTPKQAMIVTSVLMGRTTFISSLVSMDVSFDTVISDTGNAYVKFRDDEFLPRYVIYYTGYL